MRSLDAGTSCFLDAGGWSCHPRGMTDPSSRSLRAVVALLRLTAAAELMAVAGVFMPRSWMSFAHEWIGLGPLPPRGIFDYLARGLSLLYMVHGGLLWIFAGNVARYLTPILFCAWTGLAYSLIIMVVCANAGLPPWWALGEGLGLAALSVALLALLRNVPAGPPAER